MGDRVTRNIGQLRIRKVNGRPSNLVEGQFVLAIINGKGNYLVTKINNKLQYIKWQETTT